jgi:trehalose utilization protein
LAGVVGATLAGRAAADSQRAVLLKVTVWDERQPAQKEAYANFLGNAVADHLRAAGGKSLEVRSVGLDDPDQGLPLALLDDTDVLIWWGHQRHGDVKDELVKQIVDRVQAGKLALLALHSAHWSKPFTACMDERSVADSLKSLPASERRTAHVERIPGDRRIMERNEKLTPYFTRETAPDGKPLLKIKLPSCVFPYVANDGKPSHLKTLVPKHPIARGVPAAWDIPQTEVYGGPFHIPAPDVTLFEEKWDNGESFLSGSLWKIGKGQVFYFRPGHETYPIYKQPIPLRVVLNAVHWLAAHKGA